MSNQNLLLYNLLCELEIYELGNEGMFDGHLDSTIWNDTHKKSKKNIKKIVDALEEENAREQKELILDTLVQYDEEKTGMFDAILLENGRKAIELRKEN
jgi:hypothetical protein